MSTEVMIVFLLVVLLLYAMARLFTGQLRYGFVFLLYLCLGAGLLFITNWLGRYLGFALAVNPFSLMVAGFLNLPGIILLLIIRYIFKL